MKRRAALLVLLLATLAPAGREPGPDAPLPFDPAKPLTEAERSDRVKRVQPGLTPEQVRHLLGPPGRSARQILHQGAREQWLYDAPFAVRLEFEYERGKNPHLLSVQPVGGKP